MLGLIFCLTVRQVTEYWLNETYLGWCNSKLINSTVAIKFLGSSPQLYKPGMPFVGQVRVTAWREREGRRRERERERERERGSGKEGGRV